MAIGPPFCHLPESLQIERYPHTLSSPRWGEGGGEGKISNIFG